MDRTDGYRPWARCTRQRSSHALTRWSLDCGMRLQHPPRANEGCSVSRCPHRIDQQPTAHARGLVHGSPKSRATRLTAHFLLDDRLLLHGAQTICRISRYGRSTRRTDPVSKVFCCLHRTAFARLDHVLRVISDVVFRSVCSALSNRTDFVVPTRGTHHGDLFQACVPIVKPGGTSGKALQRTRPHDGGR